MYSHAWSNPVFCPPVHCIPMTWSGSIMVVIHTEGSSGYFRGLFSYTLESITLCDWQLVRWYCSLVFLYQQSLFRFTHRVVTRTLWFCLPSTVSKYDPPRSTNFLSEDALLCFILNSSVVHSQAFPSISHIPKDEWITFYSQEWSISNFPCSLTRSITSHSMEN